MHATHVLADVGLLLFGAGCALEPTLPPLALALRRAGFLLTLCCLLP